MAAYVFDEDFREAPRRYDVGIRVLPLGKLGEVYDCVASYVKQGGKVLDIGCGMVFLAIRTAKRGAWVRAIDVNSTMLAVARRRAEKLRVSHRVKLCEMSMAKL